MMKGQNAIEFLFTYALLVIILTAVIGVVFILFTAANSQIPPTCTFNGGFTCSYAVYTVNATNGGKGSQFLIIATDTQPGIINVTNVIVAIGNYQSSGGYCVPNIATAGQNIYCVASLGYTPTIGSVYVGTFNITANYCPQKAAQLYNYSCPGVGNYTYGGLFQAQAANLSLGRGGYFLPINVINTAPQQVNARTDLLVNFPTSSYTAYESNDLGNIRFYDGGRELDSWCDSGCSSGSSNTVFWIATDRIIPVNGQITIDAYFLPLDVEYDGVFAGEAPQLSVDYGVYDNGGNVFPFYDNFKGNALGSKWTILSPSNVIVNVSNGAEIKENTAAGQYGGIYSSFSPSGNVFVISYLDAISPSSGIVNFLGYGTGGGSTAPSSGFGIDAGSGSGTSVSSWSAGSESQISTVADSFTSNALYKIKFSWTGSSLAANDITSGASTSTSSAAYRLQQVTQTGVFSSGTAVYKVYWYSVVAAPPGGVMPTLVFGSAAPVP